MNICWKDKMNPLTRVEKSLVPLGALAFVWERIAQKALWMRIIIRVGFSSFGSLLDLSECSLILAKKSPSSYYENSLVNNTTSVTRTY